MLSTTSFPFLEKMLWGNTVMAYIVAISCFLGLLLVFRVILPAFVRSIGRFEDKLLGAGHSKALLSTIEMSPPVWFVLALALGLQVLSFPPFAEQVLRGMSLTIIVGIIIVVSQRMIEQLILRYLLTERGEEEPRHVPSVLHFALSLTLWSVGVLLILSNIGINVISLVAGLGIGGIAVALAAQNILGDLFSSFSIYFDRPFTEGDFIIVGEHMGTVKKIGMKTTRLSSLGGEEIVIPNAELTSTRVRNFRRMQERRTSFTFGITYDTPLARVREIPSIVKEIIGGLQGARFSRAHFKSFGDSSLDFEVVYYLTSSNYDQYMDAQQAINLALLERFQTMGVEFAFPTRTVLLSNVST